MSLTACLELLVFASRAKANLQNTWIVIAHTCQKLPEKNHPEILLASSRDVELLAQAVHLGVHLLHQFVHALLKFAVVRQRHNR